MTDVRPAHSPIGASSMYRWAKCPGSVALSEGMPNTSGFAAQEGTAAHEAVGLCLERALSENRSTREVLKEMFDAVTVYSDYVESLAKGNPHHIEHRFDMNDIYENLYGTADAVVYEKEKRLLHVIDYKHGKGLPVEAKENSQLSYYALGVLHTLAYPCSEVQMTIVQPRCYHPEGHIRHWRVSALYFIDFELELIKAAKKTKEKKAPLSAGEHCLFCPAKPICPERDKYQLENAKKDFSPYSFHSDPAKEFEVTKESKEEAKKLSGGISLFDL